MNNGDVIRLTHFQDYRPSLITNWKAPKDKVFLAVLIGVENKDGNDPLDPMKALQDLGWRLATDGD